MEDKIIEYIKEVINIELSEAQKLLDRLDDSFVLAVEKIISIKGKVIITGVGKSGHIGSKIAATLASTGTPSFFMHADEALHGDSGMVEKDDIVIAISNSGETKEVLALYPTLKEVGCFVISITSNPKSTMAKNSDLHLCIGSIIEADHLGLAPTTSSTVTLILGDALAISLSRLRGFNKDNFALFHPGGALGKSLTGKES
ncbi:MAG: SIS domain-containing protein [Actinobacteria bacterium]|nr:SIS domain-containing protein [Actinomycetota bacterium]